MKSSLVLFVILASLSASAKEIYECDFSGPNYFLTIDDNDSITLENKFKSYSCQRDTVNFPGTEVEMRIINCESGNEQLTYYFSVMTENQIILSRDVVFAKDIVCNKTN